MAVGGRVARDAGAGGGGGGEGVRALLVSTERGVRWRVSYSVPLSGAGDDCCTDELLIRFTHRSRQCGGRGGHDQQVALIRRPLGHIMSGGMTLAWNRSMSSRQWMTDACRLSRAAVLFAPSRTRPAPPSTRPAPLSTRPAPSRIRRPARPLISRTSTSWSGVW
jgi:hypothetical protein